jgi:hypothetical protein
MVTKPGRFPSNLSLEHEERKLKEEKKDKKNK